MVEVNVFIFGRKAICPVCSGLAQLNIERENIRCNDCGEMFKIKSEGMTEKELICEKSA